MPSSQRREEPSSRNSPVRILIAEDTAMGCQLLMDGLKRARLGFIEIYSAATSSHIVDLCAQRTIDVALISEDLQDGTSKGLEAVGLLRRTRPNVRCVLLAKRMHRELTLDAFRNGAKGVFCRKEEIKLLGKCTLAVHRGQVWVDSEQLEVILQALVDSRPVKVTNLKGGHLLTKREDQVGALVAEGLTNREIAKRLSLSEHTISNYLFKMYEKLGLSSRVEFVLYFFACKSRDRASDRGGQAPVAIDSGHFNTEGTADEGIGLKTSSASSFRKPVVMGSPSASARARSCRCSSSSHRRPPLWSASPPTALRS